MKCLRRVAGGSFGLRYPHPVTMHTLTRRTLLSGTAGALVAAYAPNAFGRIRMSGYPFTLGVASGSPSPNGMVLWTRLAPEPLRGGGMPDKRTTVRWEVAHDEGFKKIAQKGSFQTIPELGHSVHAEVGGLEPNRVYFYRFFCEAEVSPVGRTRTLPNPDAKVDRMKLGYASCQHFEQGYFAAHRHLAAEDLDLMVFLGDYIYESSWGDARVRRHSDDEGVARSLVEYRNRHAQYKTDRDLQTLHGSVPWLLAWDDHEVANDYAGLNGERLDPDFALRRAAAYQAYWEHMPLRMSQRPRGPNLERLYARIQYGRLADLYVLDGRQYKSKQSCPKPGIGGGNVLPVCPGIADRSRSLLGRTQEAWLARGLKRTPRQWNVIAQPTLLAPVDRRPGPGTLVWTDGWDGYPAARKRLTAQLARKNVQNPLVIGGDVHMFAAADVHTDPARPDSPIAASEVCGTSITSQGLRQEQVDAVLPENPHIKLGRSDVRGYVTLEATPKGARFNLRTVDDVTRPDADISTLASFAVEPGRPGLQKA